MIGWDRGLSESPGNGMTQSTWGTGKGGNLSSAPTLAKAGDGAVAVRAWGLLLGFVLPLLSLRPAPAWQGMGEFSHLMMCVAEFYDPTLSVGTRRHGPWPTVSRME